MEAFLNELPAVIAWRNSRSTSNSDKNKLLREDINILTNIAGVDDNSLKDQIIRLINTQDRNGARVDQTKVHVVIMTEVCPFALFGRTRMHAFVSDCIRVNRGMTMGSLP
jgi:hypothetical protein